MYCTKGSQLFNHVIVNILHALSGSFVYNSIRLPKKKKKMKTTTLFKFFVKIIAYIFLLN